MISDASLAIAPGLMSQLGYTVLMTYDERLATVMQYGLSRCHYVTRSAMAAEVHALIHAVDVVTLIGDALNELLGRTIALEAYVDSRSLFKVVTKNRNTAERRLQNDMFALRDSYQTGELKSIGWIQGKENPADALAKDVVSERSALWRLMTESTLNVDPIG